VIGIYTLLYFLSDTYVILEMDSYGHFFKKAKTKPVRGSDPSWEEVGIFYEMAFLLMHISYVLWKLLQRDGII